MTAKIADYLFRSSNILALDIGSRYMKVMELEQSDDLPILRGAAIAPVPPGSIENGVILNQAAVASALRKMLDKNRMHGNCVYLAAGGPNLVLRWIEMPAMSDSDLREALKFEARKHLPFPVEQAVLDCRILGQKDKEPEEKLRLLLIAAPRTLVDSRFETAALAGLKPMGMDVEPLAVLRALERGSSRRELAWGRHPQAVLVFGSAGTDFYVTKDLDLEFARRIPIGGSNLAQPISDSLGLDAAEVDEYEMLRRLHFDPEGRPRVQDASPELMSALESEIARLDQEIGRSCSYYESLFPEGSYEGVLTQVIIAGGLAGIEGFAAHLGRELDLPVETTDPLARITVRNTPEKSDFLNGRRTSFIVSAGLFLSQVAT